MTILECKLFLTETMNLWDDKVWNFIVQIGILTLAIAVSNCIRRKVKFIKNSLVPTTVIGGLLLLALKFIPKFDALIDKDFMETLTYHTLGLGFIAMSLKVSADKKEAGSGVVLNTGILTVNTYLIQAIFGLGITLLMAVTVMPSLYSACGILLPLGYGQGPGQALNFGKVFEADGFDGGASFGLTVAAAGFLFACIVGVIYMNYLKRKGKLKIKAEGDDSGYISAQEVSNPNEIPLTESVDKFTMQMVIVFVVYFVSYLTMYGLSWLSVKFLGNFGVNTLRPLIYGFNFLFGVVFSVVAKKIMNLLKKAKLMNRQYPNNFLLNRISGFMFDLMIISGICAIDLFDLGRLFIPLAIICVVGGAVTLIYLRKTCDKLYPGYENEAFFSMFGMLTGTASTGMILLREIDPKFETPAANNLVFQSLPAIVFGFPILLLVPLSSDPNTMGDSNKWAFIVLLIVIALFVVYNIILFRKQIFKKKTQR